MITSTGVLFHGSEIWTIKKIDSQEKIKEAQMRYLKPVCDSKILDS